MELATIETQSPILSALQSTKIGAMPKADALKIMVDVLAKAYYEAGITPPGSTPAQQATHLRTLATSLYLEAGLFKYLRIDELAIIFRKGVRGEYGDYFSNLSIATFYKWIKAWQTDADRLAASAALKQAKETTYAAVMDDTEAETAWRATIMRQFKRYKATGVFICDFPQYHYQRFTQMGLINLSNAQKQVLYAQAQKQVIAAKKQQRLNPRNVHQLRAAAAFLKRAEENTLTHPDLELFKQQAKYLAIKQYYDGIEELKLTIDD